MHYYGPPWGGQFMDSTPLINSSVFNREAYLADFKDGLTDESISNFRLKSSSKTGEKSIPSKIEQSAGSRIERATSIKPGFNTFRSQK